MAMGALTASAEAVPTMVVDMATAGVEDARFELSSIEKLTFGEGKMMVTGKDAKVTSYEMADVARVYIDVPGGVSDIVADTDGRALIHVPGSDMLAVTGVETPVSVYDTNGRLMLVAQDPANVNVAALTDGNVYIVTTADFSAKFVK